METKAGIISADIKSVDTTSGSFEAVLSAPTLDRDLEIIDERAFDPLPDHITIDIDHSMSVTSIVGSGTPYYDGGMLMFRGSFASTPLAQEVRTLVVEGHVNKMSVAFRAAIREIDEKDGLQHVRSGELLNAAIVAIPSNREADILMAKALASVDALKSGARHSASDLEHIQNAHDALSHLGAACKETPILASLPAADARSTLTELAFVGAARKSPTEDPETPAAAPAAAASPAPNVAKAMAALAEATLLLST